MNKIILLLLVTFSFCINAAPSTSHNAPPLLRKLTFTSCTLDSEEENRYKGQLMLAEVRRFAYASNLEYYHEAGPPGGFGTYFCYKVTYWV